MKTLIIPAAIGSGVRGVSVTWDGESAQATIILDDGTEVPVGCYVVESDGEVFP